MFLNDIDKQYIKTTSTFFNDKPTSHWNYNVPSRVAFSTPSVPRIPSSPSTSVSGATSSLASSAWKAGDRVTHRVFGEGTVVRVYRDEVTENDKIEINFDTQGTKTLLLTHAKLEKI
jgi:DNA helicase-2/ATP-dependent DNA helicase PcrA